MLVGEYAANFAAVADDLDNDPYRGNAVTRVCPSPRGSPYRCANVRSACASCLSLMVGFAEVSTSRRPVPAAIGSGSGEIGDRPHSGRHRESVDERLRRVRQLLYVETSLLRDIAALHIWIRRVRVDLQRGLAKRDARLTRSIGHGPGIHLPYLWWTGFRQWASSLIYIANVGETRASRRGRHPLSGVQGGQLST